MFEEADAVGDARGFLKGTDHDRAPSRGDAQGGRSGLSPSPGSCVGTPLGSGREHLYRAAPTARAPLPFGSARAII